MDAVEGLAQVIRGVVGGGDGVERPAWIFNGAVAAGGAD